MCRRMRAGAPCHVVAKQVPSLELCECLIETVRYGDVRTGFAQPLMHHALNVGDAPALGFELQRITPALEDADDVRNAGDGADRLEDRALDSRSPSAIGYMEGKHARACAPCEVLDHARWYCCSGRLGGSFRNPPRPAGRDALANGAVTLLQRFGEVVLRVVVAGTPGPASDQRAGDSAALDLL